MKIITVLIAVLSFPLTSMANDLTQRNKEFVVNFYNEVILNAQHEKLDMYIGNKYIQHNPIVPDGKEALRELIKSLEPTVKSGGPIGKIIRVVAEGDLVALHVNFYYWPNEKTGGAIMDFFRLENGKIVEHWDVTQEIPEESANDNGMF